MSAFLDWFDDRTGYRALTWAALYERVPGGSRWRYVWGSTLVFAFVMQVVTGIFLSMSYSPSSQTAWESVYYIQHEMQYGWLLRGLHHFMAQVMVVLLVLHLLQVVADGAYRAPREVNFWVGLVLMLIVLGLSLTGYSWPPSPPRLTCRRSRRLKAKKLTSSSKAGHRSRNSAAPIATSFTTMAISVWRPI